jgi:hemerythrin-like domain-containing protein
MRPTEILMTEHRVIEQVLNCLEELAAQCAAANELDAVSARQVLDFFRVFADECHHGKEERHLFPALETKGFSRQRGPTGVMLREHDQGRRHLRAMAEAVAGAAGGDRQAVRQFVTHARAYVQLLRAHIQKEDGCLFPMADVALTDEDRQDLLASFARVENEEMHAQTHEKYLRLANELADRLGVPRAFPEPETPRGCCSCGHGAWDEH